MVVLMSEGDTGSLERRDLLTVIAIWNQWLSLLELTKHLSNSFDTKSFSQPCQVQDQSQVNWTSPPGQNQGIV